jgi:adenosine deaminase
MKRREFLQVGAATALCVGAATVSPAHGAPGSLNAPAPAALVKALPKGELHAHLEGTVRPATFAELARKNNIKLPVNDVNKLFAFKNLDEFLNVFHLIMQSLVTSDDYRRVTYESLQDAVTAGVRYREMFFSPGFRLNEGQSIDVIWEGIRQGVADAQADLDIRCRMILDVDKPSGPEKAMEMVEFAARQDRNVLIGIGGDSVEQGIDHHAFAPAFQRAAMLGLHRTIHAGEDGPPTTIRIALDELGCQRIDHGVTLLEDPALTEQVVAERIPLTVCPLSNVLIANVVPDVAHHPIREQRARGVLATVNSDDPAMTATSVADDYVAVSKAFGWTVPEMEQISLDGIEACWAPDDERAALTERFEREFNALRSRYGLPARTA